MRSTTFSILSCSALLLAACGDSGSGDAGPDATTHDGGTDAGPIDSGMVDTGVVDSGPVDSGPPDGGPTHSGLISIADVQVFNHPELGHGGNINVSFTPIAGGPAPVAVVDHRTALGTGCVGVVYHAADLAAALGVDEGTVAFSGTAATIPDCHFVTGRGYLCIGASGTGATTVTTGGALPAGTALYTVVGGTFAAADVGRYLSIGGDTTNPTNNGAFPILAFMGATSVIVGNPVAVLVATPFTSMYATVAGAGPVPGAPAPDFMNAGDDVVVTLTMGGAGDFPSFTSPAVVATTPFTLLTSGTGVTALDSVPADGTAFSQGCDASGGTCDGLITAIAIDTTDGATTSLPDFVMPSPTGMVAQVRCAEFGTSVTVPADVMALVMTAAPTRIRTTVLRDGLDQETHDLNHTNVIVGNGWVGFTSP